MSWTPSGSFLMRLRKAIAADFDEPALILLTNDYFAPDRAFASVSPAGFGKTMEFRVFELIDAARKGNWLVDLLSAVQQRRPDNAVFKELAEQRGLLLAGPRID